VAGGSARPAPGLRADDEPTSVVGWSTDATAIFIQDGTDVPVKIDRIDIRTGRRTLLREIGPADQAGYFFLTPQTVSQEGAQYAFRYWKRLSTLYVVSPSQP
jgi:hypothetical protein